MTKAIYTTIFIVVLTFFYSGNGFAQGFPGDCSDPANNDPECNPDTSVPIDGGASILVAAGVAYGIKKIRDKRKQNKEEAL